MEPIELFRDVYQIHEQETLDRLCELASVRTLKKGEVFLRQGEVQQFVMLQISGIVRGYFTEMDGDKPVERTDCFSFQLGNAAMPPCGLDEPSPISVMALTPCEMVVLPIAQTIELVQHSQEAFRVYTSIMTESMRLHNGIKNALCSFSAKQKYEWFLQEYPGLLERINNRYIASFLNMTPETLSRLHTADRRSSAL